jgi:microcystin-dependent protein
MSSPFVGEIRAFGFHFAPFQWAFCDGQIMPITQNQALFTIIGTTYGGNGATTFALPNMQDSAPMHWGNGAGLTPRTPGEILGTPTVTVTVAEMPIHNHMILSAQAATLGQETGTPSAAVYMGDSNPGTAYSDTTGALSQQFSQKAISPNGGSQSHQNLQPLLTLNFCIALFGIFPTRN